MNCNKIWNKNKNRLYSETYLTDRNNFGIFRNKSTKNEVENDVKIF